MKLRILTICLIVTSYVHGQETILKEKKGESYYVLKSDPKIKHGTYQYSKKKQLIEKGQYDNGKKIGVWEFYDSDGSLEQKYDYSANQLLFNKSDSQFTNCKMIVEGKPTDKPEVAPVFIGGFSRYKRLMMQNLKYPEEAKTKGLEGRETILVSLSKTGEITGLTIYKAIDQTLDQEAIRLINELPHEWIPAKNMSQSVDVIVALPVMFTLNEIEKNWDRSIKTLATWDIIK